jgi:hypothetical protein
MKVVRSNEVEEMYGAKMLYARVSDYNQWIKKEMGEK